jgi:hypothetical protein
MQYSKNEHLPLSPKLFESRHRSDKRHLVHMSAERNFRRPSTFVIGSAIVLVLLAALVPTMWSIAGGSGTRVTLALPSNGWTLSMPGEQAIRSGAFHASVTGNTACAWIGDTHIPTLWPAGYRLGTNPIQLIGPDGTVVANEGDVIETGGGFAGSVQCGAYSGPAWSVQSPITIENLKAP